VKRKRGIYIPQVKHTTNNGEITDATALLCDPSLNIKGADQCFLLYSTENMDGQYAPDNLFYCFIFRPNRQCKR